MGRLLPNHLFEPLLKNILYKATKVVTNKTHVDSMLKLGIDSSKLWVSSLIAVNTNYFKPDGDIANELPKDKPVILSIGKLAEVKGTYDLLRSFEPLKDEAYLVYITGGPNIEKLSREIRLMKMEESVIVLPPIPPWRVPEFFRGSCCVVHAERDFPIVRHTPILPREIIACGRCFVVSEEIYRKYNFLKDGVNCLVFNPHDHKQFTSMLKKVISDSRLRKAMESEAYSTSSSIENFDEYVKENLKLFESLIRSS